METQLKKVDQPNLNEAYQKVLLWFFSFPNKTPSLTDLTFALNLSKTTTNKVVKQLEKEGFIEIETIGKNWRIKCNKKHVYNRSKKVSYNLMSIYRSGILEQIKRTVQNPRAIILFGSYRNGDDDDNSDIDIAVEVLDNKETRIKHIGTFPKFGYRKNVPVNLYIFSRNKVDINIFANIVNGIVLEGFLEAKP